MLLTSGGCAGRKDRIEGNTFISPTYEMEIAIPEKWHGVTAREAFVRLHPHTPTDTTDERFYREAQDEMNFVMMATEQELGKATGYNPVLYVNAWEPDSQEKGRTPEELCRLDLVELRTEQPGLKILAGPSKITTTQESGWEYEVEYAIRWEADTVALHQWVQKYEGNGYVYTLVCSALRTQMQERRIVFEKALQSFKLR